MLFYTIFRKALSVLYNYLGVSSCGFGSPARNKLNQKIFQFENTYMIQIRITYFFSNTTIKIGVRPTRWSIFYEYRAVSSQQVNRWPEEKDVYKGTLFVIEVFLDEMRRFTQEKGNRNFIPDLEATVSHVSDI